MAFRLTRQQRDEWEGHRRLLVTHHRKVLDVYEWARLELANIETNVNAAIGVYNQAQQRAAKFCRDVGAEFRCELDDKSEKWLEGDRGHAATAFVEAWEECDGLAPLDAMRLLEPDPPEMPALPDLPEEADDV